MKTVHILLIIFGSIFASNCKKDDGAEKTLSLTKSQKVIVVSANSFGFNLLTKVVNEAKPQENVFISPLSVSLALSMTYNGAANATRDSIQKTLGNNGLSTDEINQSCRDLISALKDLDSKVIMEIANSIWYDKLLPVKPNFLEINKTYFDAEVTKTIFSDPSTLNLINGWVNTKTHGKIPTIIDEIPSNAVMYLINAIYFKGTWKYEFDKAKTTKYDFTQSNGTKLTTDFMVQKATFKYVKNSEFSAVELPYGDGNFSMMVLLPEPGKTVQNIIENLNYTNWKAWNQAMNETENVQVYLPKFRLSYNTLLNKSLSAMGMQIAFDPNRADFSNIDGAMDLCISRVIHKTFVDVNEEGTEAAAATAVEIVFTSAGPGETITFFKADKPFVYIIKEKQTNAILFMGVLQKPVLE